MGTDGTIQGWSPATAQPLPGLLPRRGTRRAVPAAARVQLGGAPRSLPPGFEQRPPRSLPRPAPLGAAGSAAAAPSRRAPSRCPTAQPRYAEHGGDRDLPASRPVHPGAPPEGTVRERGGLGTASTAGNGAGPPPALTARLPPPGPARPYHGSRAAAPRSLAAVAAAGRDFYRARPAPSRRCHLTAAAGAAPARRAAVTRLRGAARPGPAPGRGIRETGPA